ncbi:MAG: hypothetical protein NVS4B6_23690 [Mycobacterium sp.]
MKEVHGLASVILQPGLLPRGTALYDLTVAEDHSFVVEGLISHNSNCRCTWFLRRRQDGNVEATWVAEDLGPRICATCRGRAHDWNPLVLIPGQPAPSAGVPRSNKLRWPSRVLMPVSA